MTFQELQLHPICYQKSSLKLISKIRALFLVENVYIDIKKKHTHHYKSNTTLTPLTTNIGCRNEWDFLWVWKHILIKWFQSSVYQFILIFTVIEEKVRINVIIHAKIIRKMLSWELTKHLIYKKKEKGCFIPFSDFVPPLH